LRGIQQDMGADDRGQSNGRSFWSIAGKTVAWILIVIVLVSLGLNRAESAGGSVHFRSGYALGSVLTSLAIAFALWFVVQHAIRKRRGWPPWIGVGAIGISVLLLGLQAARDAVAPAGAAPAAATSTRSCEPVDQAYGQAPQGWTYEKADAETRKAVLEPMAMGQTDGADVTLATREDVTIVMVGFPNQRPTFTDEVEIGARQVGATISEGPYRDAIVVDYHKEGVRSVFGRRGCAGIMVGGEDHASVEQVARAVFG
jgi:hypothetical protein